VKKEQAKETETPKPSMSVEEEPLRSIHRMKFWAASNVPIIYITSWEEERVEGAIKKISEELGKQVICWSCTSGLTKEGRKLPQSTEDPLVALDYILQEREPTSFIFYDFHHYMKPGADIRYIRKMREVAKALRVNPHTLFIICTVLYISEDLEKDITYIDFPLPNFSEVLQLLERMIKKYGSEPGYTVELDDAQKEELAKAALGLTLDEATEAFSKSLVNDKRLTIDDQDEVLVQKVQVIKKTQVLEYSPPEESLKTVGGLELVREWLGRRREAFLEEAREYNLPAPKGILLVGMPGCGKSLCAKAISAEWRFPTLRLDMGRIFSVAGVTPEENLRKAIKTAESIAPCVFWVDEIEKGFPRSVASASDVSARLLGHFLTWMQEKTSHVFIFATANDIGNVPPELLRRGRFDELFFVDFPNPKEREAIWGVQFKRYEQDAFQKSLDEKDLKKLVQLSRGFSGAEIEQCLIDAMFGAFSDRELPRRPVEFNDLIAAIQRMKPLSQSMRDELGKMRDAAEPCAILASTYVAEEVDEFPLELGREISRGTQEETDS